MVFGTGEPGSILPLSFFRSRKDELTGLPTMMEFMNQAKRRLAEDGSGAFLYFNIENFRMINKNYGFIAGNSLLCKFSKQMRQVFGDVPMARLNDDRFIVMTSPGEARVLTQLDNFRERMAEADPRFTLVIKVGGYEPNPEVKDVAHMLDRAKMACDSIRGIYDTNFAWFQPSMEEDLNLKSYIVGHFEEALEKHWIEAWYQPEVRVATGEICGFEALARWNDPIYGMLPPVKFVSVLEDSHLSHRLDLYMLREVCEDFRRIDENAEEGWKPTHVSVNLSRIDFQLVNMRQEIELIRREYGVSRDRLHIEITESALNDTDKYFKREIELLRSDGYELWMDDFGSGYSSLNTLKDFHFDTVKLDMEFLKDFDTKPETKTILSSIINMAKRLGLRTLTEGVETEEQFAFLREIGCEIAQGFLFSRPVPLQEAVKLYNGDNDVSPKLGIEPVDADAYYKEIGHVNVLAGSPLSFPVAETPEQAEDADHVPVYYDEVPFAILEIQAPPQQVSRTYHAIYHNAQLMDFMHACGFPTIDEAFAYLLKSEHTSGKSRFLALIDRALCSEDIQSAENVMGGKIFNMQMRRIAMDEERGRAAIACQIIDLSRYGVDHHMRFVDVASQHLMQIYTRIDLFREDGSAECVYVDATQKRVMNGISGKVLDQEGLRRYAQLYIVPQEREAFLDFYRLEDVRERAARSQNDHVTAFFHVSDEISSTPHLEMFIIVPFEMDGSPHYLSCVRRIDGIDQRSPVRNFVIEEGTKKKKRRKRRSGRRPAAAPEDKTS
jgi:EAL domain-containing protein (putative c-di-GMP-specific phosphodiesterase class I)/GGDEF domain-containing protein